jgi:hypothetical protein
VVTAIHLAKKSHNFRDRYSGEFRRETELLVRERDFDMPINAFFSSIIDMAFS